MILFILDFPLSIDSAFMAMAICGIEITIPFSSSKVVEPFTFSTSLFQSWMVEVPTTETFETGLTVYYCALIAKPISRGKLTSSVFFMSCCFDF